MGEASDFESGEIFRLSAENWMDLPGGAVSVNPHKFGVGDSINGDSVITLPPLDCFMEIATEWGFLRIAQRRLQNGWFMFYFQQDSETAPRPMIAADIGLESE
jgi:hypothetical protein